MVIIVKVPKLLPSALPMFDDLTELIERVLVCVNAVGMTKVVMGLFAKTGLSKYSPLRIDPEIRAKLLLLGSVTVVMELL